MTPQLAAITLNLIPGLGPVKIKRLMEFFGSAELVLEAPAETLVLIPQIGPDLAYNITNWRNITNADKELELANLSHAKVTTLFDEDYPEALRHMSDPPIVLYSWGNWIDRDQKNSVAVVGSRMATHYGRLCTKQFSYHLAEAGCTIISGLARGIDTEAHHSAIEAQGRTIAIIGAGLNRLYPQENKDLANLIADGHGAVISEFPMNQPPSKTTFPMRNRIVSGWAQATLVVEAPNKSGALITARMAAEMGKPVYAIPGPIDRHSSDGCHELIRDGATLVTRPFDIIEDMHWGCKTDDLPLFTPPSSSKIGKPTITDEDSQILKTIKQGFNTIDGLCTALGAPAHLVTGKLAQLQIQGYVTPDAGGFFHCNS